MVGEASFPRAKAADVRVTLDPHESILCFKLLQERAPSSTARSP